jgi:hypothetical protein
MTAINNRAATDGVKPLQVSPALIQAAKLRVTINDKLGRATDPAIRALAGRTTSANRLA